MSEKLDPELLKRLETALNEVNEALEEIDPDSDEATTLFEPVQNLGWALDEITGKHS